VKSQALYKDYPVEIADRGIVFDWYYLPLGSKRVPFEDIEWIAITQLAPSDRKMAEDLGHGRLCDMVPS
jgi:hypothetical protein